MRLQSLAGILARAKDRFRAFRFEQRRREARVYAKYKAASAHDTAS